MSENDPKMLETIEILKVLSKKAHDRAQELKANSESIKNILPKTA
jgi:hypothetical protein